MTDDLFRLTGQKPISMYDFVKLHAAEFTLDGTALERPIRRGLLLYEAFAWGRGTAANGRQQSESPNVKQVPPAYALRELPVTGSLQRASGDQHGALNR